MKNIYGNKLKKIKALPQETNQEKTKNLNRLNHNNINNGIKLNTYSGIHKKENKIRESNQNKNSLKNSYNLAINYAIVQTKNKNCINNYNNHSLFDSNKQKVINPQNSNNYVQFVPKNQNNYRNNNKNKLPLYALRNIYISNLKPRLNDEYTNEYFRKIKYEDKYEKKINNIKNKDRNQTRNNNFNKIYKNYSNHKLTFTNSEPKNKSNKYSNKSLNFSKYRNNIKNHSINNRNRLFNISNNLTEVNSNYDYSRSPTKSISKYVVHNYSKKNILDNNHLNNNSNNNNNLRNKNMRPSSFMKGKNFSSSTNIYNKRNNRLHISDNYITKTNKNINQNKLISIMPIELNIEYTNKEKLSRLKRIIEKSSASNFFQIELQNNIRNKIVKSEDKKNNLKENNEKIIFKKKKIKMRLKDDNKDEDINNNYIYENNILITSPINNNKSNNKLYKANTILNNNQIKNNNKIQSSVASYNLFVDKENKNIRKHNENKLSSKETDHTSYLNNNKDSKSLQKRKIYRKKNIEIINNNDDTISLSYSKEQNLSIYSKNKKNEDKSICLPFFQENFNIVYNKYNKKLIINEKNKYSENNTNKKGIIIDSDDEDYQLTKEIILLKKGLAQKSELGKEIKKKLKKIRPERIYYLTLLGEKKIYKKKSSNYKHYVFYN